MEYNITDLKFGIMSVPTLMFMKNGKSVKQVVGFHSKEQLKAELKG